MDLEVLVPNAVRRVNYGGEEIKTQITYDAGGGVGVGPDVIGVCV